MLSRLGAAALGPILILAAVPLQADWLVTQDGYRLETAGAWTVEGDTVVFRLVGGTLSSMPAAEIDLEASRRLTEITERDAVAVESDQPIEKPTARWVITDQDVDHVDSEAEPASEDETGESAGAAATAGDILEVVSWERIDVASPGGLEIVGTVHNPSSFLAANIALTVTLRTPAGDELGRAGAVLERQSLAPDQTTEFRAYFPDVYDFDQVEFGQRSVALQFGPDSPPAEAAPEETG